MKKYCLIIIFILFFLQVPTQAKSIWDVEIKRKEEIINPYQEKVTPIRNTKGNITGLDITLIIPKEEDKDLITIRPSIFESLTAYKSIIPGENLNINLKIINNSNYDYSYQEDSFILKTKDLSNTFDINNYQETTAIGFDNLKIYDNFSPFRTFNEPILSLYNYQIKNDYSKLTDYALNSQLQQIGYNGIKDLSKYYLDYYNQKYNLNEPSLDKFTYSTIKEIFIGEISNIKETNKEVIELSYNYFYNKLISLNFNEEITDYNSEKYSIGEYMRNISNKDKAIKSIFNLIPSKKSKTLNNILIHINEIYTALPFTKYQYQATFEFNLQKQVKKPEETIEISPPSTRVLYQ